jgi:hypothetical protein
VNRRAKRAYSAFVAAVVVVVLVALVVGAQGQVDTYGSADSTVRVVSSSAPGWAAPCLRTIPRDDRRLLKRCARVKGRVLWVKTRQEAGGRTKVHALVVARFQLFLAKFPPNASGPRMAGSVTVIGPMVRARNGLKEIQVMARE